MISAQKVIAWFLIGLLLFQEIFRIPFLLPGASALDLADHEDVVSIIVEENFYNEASDAIENYAKRIQRVLPSTRAVILRFSRDTSPAVIAATNDRIYSSGLPDHGNKTQKLVGTILIGNIPLPVVHANDVSFLSIFPYVDFDEPHFVWNTETRQYEYLDMERKDERADVWHSVISPNTGDLSVDVRKVQEFFQKVYEYDGKKGRYIDIGKDPQVFYMDSVNESRAVSPGLLGAYENLTLPYQEDSLYHRYFREFAQYIYESYLSLMESRGAAVISNFRNWKKSPESQTSFLDHASDITTKIFTTELLPSFTKVINETLLSNIRRWVHNTGRYYDGYSKVRVDMVPTLITKKDDLTGQVLKEANDALEKVIDEYVDNNMAVDIPLLVSRSTQKTISERAGISTVSRTYDFTYDNYFFGAKASDITDARDCSLVRGSQFYGYPSRAEVSHAYATIEATQDSAVIQNDLQEALRCTNLSKTYWGGNSPLNTDFSQGELEINSRTLDDFVKPAIDLGAGQGTTAPSGTPRDCLRTDMILRPFKHAGIAERFYTWPIETDGQRYSCATRLDEPTGKPFFLDPTPESTEDIFSSIESCGVATGNVSILSRENTPLTSCRAGNLSGTYKLISSLVRRNDPTTEVYGQQLKSVASPRLPIDGDRYLLYLGRDLTDHRIDYPNLFDVVVSREDTDEVILGKIRTHLEEIARTLRPGVDVSSDPRLSYQNKTTSQAPNLANILLADQNISRGLIDALRWRATDIEQKYALVFDAALSSPEADANLILPEKKDLYEIAYMGGAGDATHFQFGFNPDEKIDLPEWYTNIADLNANFSFKSRGIEGEDSPLLTDFSQDELAKVMGNAEKNTDSECGDPDGVVIWKWPAAIACWLKNLFKTKWETPDLSDFGFSEPSITIGLGSRIIWSTKTFKSVDLTDENNNHVIDFIEENSDDLDLEIKKSDSIVDPGDTVRIDTILREGDALIDDDLSRAELLVRRIDDYETDTVYTEASDEWPEIISEYVDISGSAQLRDGHAIWTVSTNKTRSARVLFDVRISDGETSYVLTKNISILIGPQKIIPVVKSSEGAPGTQTVIAGDPNGLDILVSGTTAGSVRLEITDFMTGDVVFDLPSVSVQSGVIHLSGSTLDTMIKKSGRYTVNIFAGDDAGKTHFSIVPGTPHHIVVKSPDIFIAGVPMEIELGIFDVLENVIDMKDWQMEISFSEPIKALGNTSQKDFSIPATERLTIEPIVSGSLTALITLKKDDIIIQEKLEKNVISDLSVTVDIPDRDKIEVGQEVAVNLSIRRKDGSIIEAWNQPLELDIEGVGKFSSSSIEFKNGQGKATLITEGQPGSGSIYVPGIQAALVTEGKFSVQPGAPVFLSLAVPSTMSARTGIIGAVTVTPYDAYGNKTDLRGNGLRMTVDKPELFTSITPFASDNASLSTSLVSRGKPGRALLRAWLEKDGKPIPRVESVAKIILVPELASEEVATNSWQSLAQVMLGGPFGQIPTQGYFSGASLFSPRTNTLAVTTLVDTPVVPVFHISPRGDIVYDSGSSSTTSLRVERDASQTEHLRLHVSSVSGGPIATIDYPAMTGEITYALCPPSQLCDRNQIVFSAGQENITVQDGVVLQNGQELFRLVDILQTSNIELKWVPSSDTLTFNVTRFGVFIGSITFAWSYPGFSDVTDPAKITVTPFAATFTGRSGWTGSTSSDRPSFLVSLRDDIVPLLGPSTAGWSSYPDTEGLGWTGENTTLLTFASGQNIASSLRDVSDYLAINIGDPVLSLPDYRVDPDTGFDTTIGEPVYTSPDPINGFTVRDLNGDEKADIITYHDDHVGTTLVSGDGRYENTGDLLSMQDATPDMIRGGDFFGDGFADVAYIDTSGELRLVSHEADGPKAMEIVFDVAPTLGQISQIEVFDMDHDELDDIIVMDTLGSLYVFYGKNDETFVTQLVDHVYDLAFDAEAKSVYFMGSVRYSGAGFKDVIATMSNLEDRAKQDIVHQSLFTQVQIPRPASSQSAPVPEKKIGEDLYASFNTDDAGFMRMYEGDPAQLANELRTGFNDLETDNAENISIIDARDTTEVLPFLRAPFIDKNILLITKQYKSLEAGDTLVAGSPIGVTLTLKNTGRTPLTQILLQEQFAKFIAPGEDGVYTVTRGENKENRTYLVFGDDTAVLDMRNIRLNPGEILTIEYVGTLRPFSFGSFDVGYLEDARDNSTGLIIPKEKISTLNSDASKRSSIPESEFYNHDNFGDIRINPNETCGGPLLLWRSHNEYERTYHKTLIVRDVSDPDMTATNASENIEEFLDPSQLYTQANLTDFARDNSSGALEEWQQDSDGDNIPDRGDDDHGDVFAVETNGSNMTVTLGLGKLQSVADGIEQSVNDFISGLSCGFGDPGCTSMPINWAFNIPGNTMTFMGYAIPGVNQPPFACYKDVRCGIPIFSYPTICPTGTCTWPPFPTGAGGALDYTGGISTGLGVSYKGGLGISQFRLFLGGTLTGAVATAMCFGPNTGVLNPPGLFPIVPAGNCIFATAPLTQCSDDGADEDPLVLEEDISASLDDNRYSDADTCNFYTPLKSYPESLSTFTSAYLTNPNAATLQALQAAIGENAKILNAGADTDGALSIATSAPDPAVSQLAGVKGLGFTPTTTGGLINITLNPQSMKTKGFGKVLDINLKSIKAFPSFLMDWYHRQMDEIVSSIGHLPSLKIFLPDFSGLADLGWTQRFGNILSAPEKGNATENANGETTTGTPNQNTTIPEKSHADLSQAISSCSATGGQCGYFVNNVLAEMGATTRAIDSPYEGPGGKRSLINYQGDPNNIPVGAVALYNTGFTQYGHAAIVIADNGDGTVRVAESNVVAPNTFGTRDVLKSEISATGGYYIPPVGPAARNNHGSSFFGSSVLISQSTSPAPGVQTISAGLGKAQDGINSGISLLEKGVDTVTNPIQKGVNFIGTGLGDILAPLDRVKNTAATQIRQITGGIQNAFEYIGTLPIINVHPETVSFDIPWIGKQEAQAWLIRNEATLQAWKDIPKDVVDSADIGGVIASIESNIETVKSYLELPDRLQHLFYLKEKILYGILQNVEAVQNLMGGWLYDNGKRFKTWVETFILITKLWDSWQVLINVFNDYETECSVCRNERWNLQHWLWIVISAVVPPIPVVQMPRWPDIELDFSDIDLSLDVAYPVFDLKFFPVALPDIPIPSVSGFSLPTIPQLPRLPDLNIDIEVPVIQLPKLPDLPPPPKIPKLASAITVVLKIFKLVTLIQCLYRKIPLSPEWYVGTKIAHKTERQGFMPFDFLDFKLPSLSINWVDSIRVATHVKLEYNVTALVDMIRSALKPLTDFPRNLDTLSIEPTPRSVNIDLQTDVSETSASISLSDLPDLMGELLSATLSPEYAYPTTEISDLERVLPIKRTSPVENTDITNTVQLALDDRFNKIQVALESDIQDNATLIADVGSWQKGEKLPEDIPLIAENIPGNIVLAESSPASSRFLTLDSSLFRPVITSTNLSLATSQIIVPSLAPTLVPTLSITNDVPPPGATTSFATAVPNNPKLARTKGLYVTRGDKTRRLINYTEGLEGRTQFVSADDDRDGDMDLFYILGNSIYRKENHLKIPSVYHINDTPKVYDMGDIASEFFDVEILDNNLPVDGQINLLSSHSYGSLDGQYLSRTRSAHTRVGFFSSLFEHDISRAKYIVDLLPAPNINTVSHSIISGPTLQDFDGSVRIEHSALYRRLLPGNRYEDQAGDVQDLSPDFVIRSGQSGYASESTKILVDNNGIESQYTLLPGERIVFAKDSSVAIQNGSLLLFGNTSETRLLTVSDRGLPLSPGDRIEVLDNGNATISFPDRTEAQVSTGQIWTSRLHSLASGVQEFDLDVVPDWYYGVAQDARSLVETRLPHATLFDTYSESDNGEPVPQIPREISLNLDNPTEIDFQTYFPYDTVSKVEILRLPSNMYRTVNPTTIAFETEKEKREILVRVTVGHRVRDYTTTLVTKPPLLAIEQMFPSGELSGHITQTTSLPLGIQSYIDGRAWTVASGISTAENIFTTTFANISPVFTFGVGEKNVGRLDRTTGAWSNTSAVQKPIIRLGSPLGYSVSSSGETSFTLAYTAKNITYRQIANISEISENGISILGSGLRMEPATTLDTKLAGGVYITDVDSYPLIALDKSGIVRWLDTNVVWSVVTEGGFTTFTLNKGGKELGKIIVHGEAVTTVQ